MRHRREPSEPTRGHYSRHSLEPEVLQDREAEQAMRYFFGDYVLDTQRYELQPAGAPVKLRRKVFQVLAYLLSHGDQVVSKQELLEHVWPDQFVGDEALKSCVKDLRQALVERLGDLPCSS